MQLLLRQKVFLRKKQGEEQHQPWKKTKQVLNSFLILVNILFKRKLTFETWKKFFFK